MDLVLDNGNIVSANGHLLGVNTSGGITPTGNIEIQQQSGTDVTQYATASVKAGSLTNLKAVKGTVSNHSVVVTPQITVGAGWVSSAPTASTVTVNASDLVSGTLDITENGTKDVTNYASVNVNVSSGGGGKVIQYNPTITQLKNKTSYTTCNCSITVEETGTYKCTWVHWAYAAGSSSTYATQLYRAGSAVGSAHSSPIYSNATGSNFIATENSISLTAGQTIEVRARTRSGSSYYTTAGMLVIEKVS